MPYRTATPAVATPAIPAKKTRSDPVRPRIWRADCCAARSTFDSSRAVPRIFARAADTPVESYRMPTRYVCSAISAHYSITLTRRRNHYQSRR